MQTNNSNRVLPNFTLSQVSFSHRGNQSSCQLLTARCFLFSVPFFLCLCEIDVWQHNAELLFFHSLCRVPQPFQKSGCYKAQYTLPKTFSSHKEEHRLHLHFCQKDIINHFSKKKNPIPTLTTHITSTKKERAVKISRL